LIGERLDLLPPNAGGRRFEPGGSGRVEQSLQEGEGIARHGLDGMGVERRTRRRRRTLSAAAPVARVGCGPTRTGTAETRIRRSGATATRRMADSCVLGSLCTNTKLPSDCTIG